MREGPMPRPLPPVDDDVFEALQALAEPLVDDINSVLRRLLGLVNGERTSAVSSSAASVQEGSEQAIESAAQHAIPRTPVRERRSARTTKSPSKKRAPTTKRAARGTLLPEREYELPLLKSLNDRGGAAPASEVIEDVGAALQGRLTEADREVLDSGLTRWKNRVQFVRLKLVQAGHVKKDSPRGVWEITPEGRERLRSAGTNE